MTATAAERMDRIYRWQVPIYDLTRKYYLAGRDRLIADLDPPPGGSVLEIGCGTGRNLVAAERRYPDARYYGIDVSAVMLDAARKACGGRAALAHADAAVFDPVQIFGRARFDRVFFSYTLSMIPDWRGAVDRAVDALAPDGRLHAVDFGEMERLPGPVRAALRRWLAAFSVEPRAGLGSEIAQAATRRGFAARVAPFFGGYGVSVSAGALEPLPRRA